MTGRNALGTGYVHKTLHPAASGPQACGRNALRMTCDRKALHQGRCGG